MLKQYKVRITRELSVDQIAKLRKTDKESAFFVLEKGAETGKIHIQGIILTSKSENTLRNRIKAIDSTINGNEDYSVGHVDDQEGYFEYLCKGENNYRGSNVWVVLNNFNGRSLAKSKIDEWHTNYWDKYDARQKKKTPKTMYEKIYHETKPEEFVEDGEVSAEKVINHTIKWFKENKRTINAYQIQNYVVTYLLNHDESFESTFRMQILDKIYNPK